MAKFNAPLEDRDTSYRSIGPAERSGSGGEIAQLLSTGMKMYEAYAGREAAIAEQNDKIKAVEAANAFEAAKGNALTRVEVARVEEEDRAIKQGLEYQKIQADSQLLYQGGLQENEVAILADLQKQAARLDSLDPRQRQLRKNALYKKALTDYGDLGIQQEIGALFGKANNYQEPELNAQDKAIAQELDNLHGPGQWGAVEKGRKVAQMNQLAALSRDAQINVNSVGSASIQGALLTAQDTFVQATNIIKNKGFISPENRMNLIGSLEANKLKALQHLAQIESNYSRQVINVTEEMKAARENLNSTYESMTKVLTGQGAFGDDLSALNVVKNTGVILENMSNIRNPALTSSIGNLLGKTHADKIAGAAKLLNQPKGVLSEFLRVNPGVAVDAEDLQSKLIQIMSAEPATLQEGIDKGLFTPQLAVLASGEMMGESSKIEDLTEYWGVIDKTATQQSTPAKLDLFTSPGVASKIHQHRSDPQVQKRINGTAKSAIEYTLDNRSPNLLKQITVDKNGNLVMNKLEKSMSGGISNTEIDRFEKDTLQKLNKYLETYDIELGGKEQWVQKFLKQRDDIVNPKVNETTADEQ